MPSNVGYDAAAVLPFAGLVAFAGLVSQGGLALHSPGARIMVIGASGGVGHLAVQMAKHGMQASFVVAVSSTRNAEFVRSCGADYVVPYDRVGVEDLVSGSPEWVGTFDLIFDCVGIDSYYTEVSKHLLKPGGRFVSAALPHHKDGRPGEDTALLGGLALLLRLLWRRAGGRYRMIGGLIGGLPSKLGFPVMVNWLAEGKVLPRITSRYSLSQIADAHRESEGGRTVGKIVIEVGRPAL
jgi:NADPH:quinone reductase-like Zn-dependent oxidoreductase